MTELMNDDMRFTMHLSLKKSRHGGRPYRAEEEVVRMNFAEAGLEPAAFGL